MTTTDAIPADVGAPKPLDLSMLLRGAFLAGRGLKDGQKLSADDLASWQSYDPTEHKAFQRITAALDRASRPPSPEPDAKLAGALRAALNHYDRNICTHEDTYRGGSNWTICHACGMKWADDEGGFKPHEDPIEIKQAKALLSKHAGNQS